MNRSGENADGHGKCQRNRTGSGPPSSGSKGKWYGRGDGFTV